MLSKRPIILNNDLKIPHLEIKKLQTNNMTLQSNNKQLKATNKDLQKRLEEVEVDNESFEKYSRCNSLRISGKPEDKEEDTDELWHVISNNVAF